MNDQTLSLNFVPRDWQRSAFKKMERARFSVLVVHRRAGKTVMAVLLLVHHALQTKKERAFYSYVAPELKQAKAVAWEYLKHYGRMIPGTKINESELWVEFPNGARIRVNGADNPDSLRGVYFDGVVLDEVAQMRPDTWGEVIRPALSDRHGWALFLGTPKGTNLFSELWNMATAREDWCAIRLTVDDTQAIDATELESLKRDMSPDEVRQELYCDFTAASSNALIPMSLVDEARKRVARPETWMQAPIILGVDVARYGDDRSVIIQRQGPLVRQPIIMRHKDAMAVADRVAQEIDLVHPSAVFIDGSGGYGAGPIDRLRSLGHRVSEVQFGGKPADERFQNKRVEMWWRMSEWIKQGSLPDLPAWAVDLCAPTYTYANAAGKVALESKDAIKARGLPSPDLGDALALTFASPVAPPDLAARRGTVRTEFDPFAAAGPAMTKSQFDPFA